MRGQHYCHRPPTPSLVNSLSLQQLTACTPIMGASPFWHNSSLLSGCHTTLNPSLSLWTVPGTMNQKPSSPRSLRPRKASSFTASCRGRWRPCVRGYACQKSLRSTGNVSSLGRAKKNKFAFWNFGCHVSITVLHLSTARRFAPSQWDILLISDAVCYFIAICCYLLYLNLSTVEGMSPLRSGVIR